MISSQGQRRIALVTAFPPGHQSLNEYGFHLVKAFAARPDVAEVVVIADRLPAPSDELDLGPKVRVERIWDFNAPGTSLKIVGALRREQVDGAIFNVQMATFGDRELPAALGLFAPVAARVCGTPTGVIAHNLISGIDLDKTTMSGQRLRQALVRFGGRIVTRALLGANYLTVTLESYHDALTRTYPRAKVHHVPHGTFDTERRTLTPARARPLRLVTLGKFGTYKRLETLIAAFRILKRMPEYRNLELVIGGSDHPATPGYLAGVAADNSHEAGLSFQGYVAEDDIPAFFGAARVSVFDYSATTGSSGVLHQTASYGAAPVFPQIGDFVDVCQNEGLTGANYPVGDAAGMAEAIHLLLNDPDAADRLAAANREAALGMPISQVADIHMRHLSALWRNAPGRGLGQSRAA